MAVQGLFYAMGVVAIIAFIVIAAAVAWFCKYRKKQRKTHMDSMIFSLVIADGIFCIGIIFFFFRKLQLMRIPNTAFHIIWNISQGMSFTASMLHITVINTDRLIAIAMPNHYTTYLTTKRTRACLALIWLIAMAVASTLFWLPMSTIDWIITGTILLNFFAGASIYMVIAYHLKRFTAAVECRNNNEYRRSLKSKKDSIKVCLCICLTFFVCNVPFAVVTLYHSITNTQWNEVESQVIFLILSLNCLTDPIVYIIAGRTLGKNTSTPRSAQTIVPLRPRTINIVQLVQTTANENSSSSGTQFLIRLIREIHD